MTSTATQYEAIKLRQMDLKGSMSTVAIDELLALAAPAMTTDDRLAVAHDEVDN